MRPVEERLSDLLHAAVPEPPGEVSLDAVQRRVRAHRRRLVATGTAGVAAALAVAVAVPFTLAGHGSSPVEASASGSTGPDGTVSTSVPGGDDTRGPTGGGHTDPTLPTGSGVALCTPGELQLSMVWRPGANGGLEGTLTAANTARSHERTSGDGAGCGLLVKPAVEPLDRSGRPLDVSLVNTDEMRMGPDVLRPGASASAPVTWSGWCGRAAGDRVRVSWGDGGHVDITVQGPHQPGCGSGGSDQAITSGWFDPLRYPRCQARDLDMNVTWTTARDGSLHGTLTAVNPTAHSCDLLVTPVLDGLDTRNRPLHVDFRSGDQPPGEAPSVLNPGDHARADVQWQGWCGARPGDWVRVSWQQGGGAVDVRAYGRTLVPTCPTDHSKTALVSFPFGPLSDGGTASTSTR